MGEVYKVGQRVELNDGRKAVIRFIGETSFAAGPWVGVELEEPTGKNDGAVQGQRYFSCKPAYGMFLRSTGVSHILEQPKPAAAAKTNGRPASVSKGRSSSIAAESGTKSRPSSRPTSLTMESRRGSGSSSPVKRPLSTTTATVRTRQNSTMAPPAAKRNSVAPSPSPATAAPKNAPRPSVGGTGLGGRTASTSSVKSGLNRPTLTQKRPSVTSTTSPKSGTPVSTSTPATTRNSPGPIKEIQELEAKLRVLEKKRLEDREKLQALDRIQQERDKFESIIQKLQAKYQPQQQENVELKKQLKEAEKRLTEIESIQTEHDEILEMATLDREMAEEQADAYKAELDAVKQKCEELELENDILKQENQELGQEMSPEERTSAGWLQMERENERLREALIRLRDMTQEQEAELRDRCKSLEEDVNELSGVKQQYDDTKARLLECEADIEDLRQQLDAALGAEDMIEELTDRNMTLSEHIEELKAVVEDLQSLKELNDELEINHVENEKQLQEVIDFKDSLLMEQARRAAQQEETLSDQEYTISRFRELVSNLQSDLEDMRASKALSETEAQELSNRSRAMMDLNRQLQATATSTKIKTIDMELRKLDAQEASEHLSIVQLFLPEAFHAERDSVLALLRFKRIGFKAGLLQGFVKEKVAGLGHNGLEVDVFQACDVLDKLAWISTMCERFANTISSCSLDQFAKFEGALYELEPVERALNGYIEAVKRDELKEDQVADELHRSIALMSHLAEHRLGSGLQNYPDEVLMRTMLMQSRLEITASALLLIKSAVQSHFPGVPEDENGDLNRFIGKTESLVAQSRSAKVVVGKAIKSLQELKARSLSLNQNTHQPFEDCEAATEQLTLYARMAGIAVYSLLGDDSRIEAENPITLADIRSALFRTTSEVFPNTTTEAEVFSVLENKLRLLSESLVDLASLSSDLENTIEFEKSPAPWVLRSKEIAASKIVSVDAEEEIRRLKDEIHARAMTLKLRDQEHEELGVKIELLEARTKDASKKAARIKELEALLEDGKTREKSLVDELERRIKELNSLEEEKDNLKAQVEAQKMRGEQDEKQAQGEQAVATEREMQALQKEIDALEKANRYLRKSAQTERLAELKSATSWLATPVMPEPTTIEEDKLEDARRVLEDITNLPSVAQLVDLRRAVDVDKSSRSSGRLGWRPKKMTPQWQLSEEEMKRAEVWAALELSCTGVNVGKKAHQEEDGNPDLEQALDALNGDGPIAIAA